MTSRRERYPDYVVDLAELAAEQRDALPMSIGPSGVVSYYGDTVWEFRPYIHTKNVKPFMMRIDFDSLVFADGLCLNDPQHAELLASVKAFLYVRLAHKHPRSGKRLKHRSLIDLWCSCLRFLLTWMVANGHQRFAALTPTVCAAYVEASNRVTNAIGKPLGSKTLTGRFTLLQDLYAFSDQLEDSLPEHPWPGESACSLAGHNQGGRRRKGTTELIPDRLARQLAQGALRYIETDYGERLLVYREARVANEPLDAHLAQLKMQGWRSVKEEIIRLYTACYVVIDLFSGVRDSEMASLETGCYEEHEGWDGATYGWLNGITYKTEEDPKSVEWMVPPVVAKAIRLGEKVSAPIRAELEARIAELEARLASGGYVSEMQRAQDIETLDEYRRHRRSLFLSKSTQQGAITTWNGGSTCRRLRKLAEHLDLRVEAAELSQVYNRDRIRAGDIWPLASHQFRKIFAVYVARNVLGDVRYLREHFKHWSLDMTLYYTVADLDYVDETVFGEVLTQRDELQAIIIEGWITNNKPLTGAGSLKVKEWRKREGVRVAKDHRELARKLSSGFYIRGTGHSWCTSENCKGTGLYDVLACKDCSNRLIDETHLMVWRGIRNQQIELLQMNDLGDPMWQRAKDHLRYAEHILGDLNDPVEAYPIPPKPSERHNVSGCAEDNRER